MEDRRYKANLQGLLKFCTENTKYEDAPSHFEPMSEERREWLRKALDGLTSNDPVKQMMDALKLLIKSEENAAKNISDEDKLDALENIELLCEDLDLANDFFKIGGSDVLIQLLQDTHNPIRTNTANLIATLAQNNPFCQGKIMEDKHVFKYLLEKLDDENEDDDVRIKFLYAISCTIRESHQNQDIFHDLGGFSVLQKIIQKSHCYKLKLKSLFLIGSLCVERDLNKDYIIKQGLLNDIANVLGSTDTNMVEMALSALHGMVVDGHSASIQACSKIPNFKDRLTNWLNKFKESKDNEDQKVVIETIITTCKL